MSEKLRRNRVWVTGQVQGVGFRPFISKLATAAGLTGFVRNDASGVTVEIQGASGQLKGFLRELPSRLPPLARIDAMEVAEIEPALESGFEIRESLSRVDESTPVAPDVAICDDCLSEMRDPNDRRYRYPFINCTNCGPRFTIVTDVPYDRPSTTMVGFEMCSRCRREYEDPADRRFHAQPNACPDCGPKIWFVDGADEPEAFKSAADSANTTEIAVERFREAISSGRIVAVKGIGGFHLCCDATNAQAVDTLRQRKGRVAKPFALMVSNIAQAESFAVIHGDERALLLSSERPIVLLRKRPASEHQTMLELVAPDNNFVGVMLPYSPLHMLLCTAVSPLVMTSGNVSEEPIVQTNVEARHRLASLADCFLLHDRDIHVVCDDSVVRCLDRKVLPIRRSRGYAPMPVQLVDRGASVFAVGGELKSAFCVTTGNYAYMSQHIGDVGNIETLEALQRNAEHFAKLFRVNIDAIVSDLHPDYLSSQWAARLATELDVPLIRVPHHFAHAVSLLGERHLKGDERLLACCFDGTGYGTDAAIWGGEFLWAGRADFERVAHLAYFPLPGGDASIRRPYRVALALLHEYGLDWKEGLPPVSVCPEHERGLLRQQLDKRVHCVSTSSMGRLFDAIASLIGIRHEVSYEAQAAMELEALASNAVNDVDPSAYLFEIQRSNSMQVEWGPVLEGVLRDLNRDVKAEVIAAQFHHAVANMIVSVCEHVRRDSNRTPRVGLTGGVFQNVLLLQLASRGLQFSGFDVLTHETVPPNDGGIALGQAIVAREQLRRAGDGEEDAPLS